MKNIKIVFLIFIIFFISCNNSNTKSQSNDKEPIRVGTPAKHKLFSQINDNGEIEGYDIDIWEEIGRRLGRPIKWTQIDFTGGFGELELGKLDSLTQQISITPSRMEKYYFSEPYFLSPYKFCVAGSNNSINKFEDMFGKKLGLSIGSAAHENIKRLDPEGKIEIVSFSPDTIITLPNNVVNGKIDSYIEAVIIFDDRKAKTGDVHRTSEGEKRITHPYPSFH